MGHDHAEHGATEPQRADAARSVGAAHPLLRLQRLAGNAAVLRMLDSVAGGRAEPLPEDLRRTVEGASGVSMDEVVVHRNSGAPARFGAEAFTYAEHIHLGLGRDAHLAHEAWHVVQQKRGEAEAGTSVHGVPVDASPAREAEADRGPISGGPALVPVALKTADPVLQGVFTPDHADVLAKLHGADLLEVIARLDDEDLETAVELGVIGEDVLEEIPMLRMAIAVSAWQGAIPEGPALDAADVLVQMATEDADGSLFLEVLRRVLVGDLGVAYLEDCPVVQDADPDRPQVERTLPGGNDAFLPPGPGTAVIVEDTVVASSDDEVTQWVAHLVEPVAPGLVEVVQLVGEDDAPVGGDAPAVAEDDDAGMESLIEELSRLSLHRVPFETDLDDDEDHEVRVDKDPDDADAVPEVGLASKFTPLEVVRSTKHWLGVPLDAAVLNQLTQKAKTAKLALDAYSISRGKAAGAKLFVAMRAVAKLMEHPASMSNPAKMPLTDFAGTTNFNVHDRRIDGKKVVANNLSLNAATAGSPPQGDSRLMEEIRNRAGGQSKSYKEMHLLNDNLFGPGEFWNLTPGPAKSNTEMETTIEAPLKKAIIEDGLVVDFSAEVTYKNDPATATDLQVAQNPDAYRFDHIDFTAVQQVWDPAAKGGAGDWVDAGPQDPGVKKAHNKRINWNWGSLTPLAPKATLTTATKAELVASGIPDGLAGRIVALTQAEPVKVAAINGADKKQQLQDLLYDYEKHTLGKPVVKFTDWNKWRANQIVWA